MTVKDVQGPRGYEDAFGLSQLFSPNVLLPTNFFLFMHLCQCFVFQYEDPNLVIVDYASPQSTSIQGQTTIELGLARVPAILGQLTNLRLQVHAREMHV